MNAIGDAILTLERRPHHPYAYTCQFDFEVGYLVESPCRACEQSEELPRCSQACLTLDRIRSILADVVPCTRRY